MAFAEPDSDSDPYLVSPFGYTASGFYPTFRSVGYPTAHVYPRSYLGTYGYTTYGKRSADSDSDSESDPAMLSVGGFTQVSGAYPMMHAGVYSYPAAAVHPAAVYNYPAAVSTIPYVAPGGHVVGKREAEAEPWGVYGYSSYPRYRSYSTWGYRRPYNIGYRRSYGWGW